MKVSVVLDDFKRARARKRPWITEAEEDYEFAVGIQWSKEDLRKLKNKGVRGLTINKVQPNLFMISGIQRQNRSDFKAFPEGEEDSLKAEIATLLMKNTLKTSMGEYKLSEIFEDGIICGEGWIEPYVDYTYDLLNGDLKLKKVNPLHIFSDPDSIEYDLSDAEFVVKFSPRLRKVQVEKLFPDKKTKIAAIGEGRLNLNAADTTTIQVETDDYPGMDSQFLNETEASGSIDGKKDIYDLTEYYYKKYVKKYLVADKVAGNIKEATDKKEAEDYVEKANTKASQAALEAGEQPEENGEFKPIAVVIERVIPEIWVTSLIGNEEIEDRMCDFYPRWKTFPFVPFYAHRITTAIKDTENMVQGVVRSLKDPQREFNKRRTQELRLLNTSANGGWLSAKGAWVNKSTVKKFGSSPGILLEYKQGFDKPEKIVPTQLSQGHAQLAAENSQDMKELSGINTDLLAMNESKSASGRAIALRQRQGLVMIQRMLDNFGYTQRILGRFLLSQLGELYTIETATRVAGQHFITKTFGVPVMTQTEEGEQMPQTDAAGEMVLQVDNEAVGAVFNEVLNDTSIGKYDVAIGEVANSETVKYSNYLLLTELVEKGFPIPPDVLIDESQLSQGSKEKIKRAIAAAQQQAPATA